MRLVFIYKAARHIFLNRNKYMALAFFYLTGCMAGYYSLDGLSDALRITLRDNLEVRLFYRSPDPAVVFLSVLFVAIFWLAGFSPAGIILVPLVLLLSAALQSFFMQIAYTQMSLSGGLAAAGSVILFFLASAAALFLGVLSLGNALQMFAGRKRNLSLAEKAAMNNKTLAAFLIAAVLYVLLSYLLFLAVKAIF